MTPAVNGPAPVLSPIIDMIGLRSSSFHQSDLNAGFEKVLHTLAAAAKVFLRIFVS